MARGAAATAAPAPSAATPTPPAGGRDAALDLLRTAALFRVVLWHAFAATWMTTIAAMPLMFFVAGTLLGDGGTGAPGAFRRFLARRGRRLLLPFWAYGLAVAATMIHAPLGDDRWESAGGIAFRAVSWVIPLVDPVGSTWHGGWLSNHLWYLRAYLWILLLAPVVVGFARHARVAVPLLLLAVAQIEVLSRLGVELPGGAATRVVAGDALTYGLFVVLGAAYARRPVGGRLPHRGWLAIGVVAAAGVAVLLASTQGVPPGGINGSYPLIAATGIAWLLAVGVAEPAIRRLAELDRVRRATSAISGRAVTIYLWHPAAIVVAQAVVGDDVPVRPLVVLAVTGLFVVVAVIAVGWVEDVAAGRGRVRLPSLPLARLTATVPATAVVLALAVPVIVSPAADAADGGAGRRGVPPPSYREALGNAAFSKRPVPPNAPFVLEDGKLPAKDLQRALHEWMEGEPKMRGVTVGLVVQGRTWIGSSDGAGGAHDLGVDDHVPVHSLTKTFTLAAVLREVHAGRIDLDRPLPAIRGIRRPAATRAITPRQLLSHTSGLADYGDARGYRRERTYSPHQAVNLSMSEPLRHAPGLAVYYANTNYLYLGLLLEHVTGRPYAELVAGLAADAGLTRTFIAESEPGRVGFSSAGVVSTMRDMTRWADALFTPDRIIPGPLLAEATTVTNHNLGLGLWPLCPCGTDAAGGKQATAIGHHVGNGGLYHYPNQMTVMIRFDPAGPDLTPLMERLGEKLRDTLRR